jgi:tRNA (guanine37-N1)-methyltransferase
MKKIPQDIIGNIALLKFPRKTFWITKKLKALKFLKQNKNITTVLEKTEGFSGKLRTLKTKHLAGIKTKEATYKENDCIFKFNVDESYFSPRLSNERKIIADQVEKLTKQNSKILIMFAGIGPYPITIAKKLKQNNKKAIIIANELNPKAIEEMKRNIALNKLQNYITIIPGDAKKIPQKTKEKFDIILMPRPNLKNTFLKTALKLSKKGTRIFYHGFGTEQEILNEIRRDTLYTNGCAERRAGKKIGEIKIRKAGDIGAFKFRWQAEFVVR